MHSQNSTSPAENGPPFPVKAVTKLLPPLGTYLEALRRSTAASPATLAGPALAAMGAAIGRRTQVEYGSTHAPLIYTLTVGPTRDSAKSTAIDRAAELVQRLADDGPEIFVGSPSAEGLIAAIPEGKSLLVFASEARTWFARGKQQGCLALPAYVAQLWDLPHVIRVATRKNPVVAREPTLGWAGASTAQWLEVALDDADFSGGLVNRLCFFDAPAVELLPVPRGVDSRALSEVAAALRAAQKADARFTMDSGAEKLWRDRFKAYNARRRELRDGNEAMSQATARVDAHAIRLALLSAALHRRSGHRIIRSDAELGWTVAEYCEAAAVAILRNLALGRIVRLEVKIRALLERRGPQNRRAIVQTLGGGSSSYTTREVNETLDEMAHAGTISERGAGYSLPTDGKGSAL